MNMKDSQYKWLTIHLFCYGSGLLTLLYCVHPNRDNLFVYFDPNHLDMAGSLNNNIIIDYFIMAKVMKFGNLYFLNSLIYILLQTFKK